MPFPNSQPSALLLTICVQFDDAFISRIHVIIRYDNLSEDDRKKIWSQFFDKLSDEREDFMITGRAKAYVLEDDNVSKMSWNGREIRNGKIPQPYLPPSTLVHNDVTLLTMSTQLSKRRWHSPSTDSRRSRTSPSTILLPWIRKTLNKCAR